MAMRLDLASIAFRSFHCRCPDVGSPTASSCWGTTWRTDKVFAKKAPARRIVLRSGAYGLKFGYGNDPPSALLICVASEAQNVLTLAMKLGVMVGVVFAW